MKHKFALVIAGILAIPCFGQVADQVPGHYGATQTQLTQIIPQSAGNSCRYSQYLPSPLAQSHTFLADNQSSAMMKYKLDSIIDDIWVTGSNAWIPGTSMKYCYDPYGNLKTEINQHWNAVSNTWVNESKGTYFFMYPGKPSIIERYNWNFMTNLWQECCKYVFTYDALGNLVNFSTWEPIIDLGIWKPVSQIDYTYDEANYLSTEIHSNWYPKEGNWRLSMKMIYEYDENYQLSLRTEYTWKPDPMEWAEYFKQEFSYDNSQQNIMTVDYFYDAIAIDWVPAMKMEYSCLTSGKVCVKLESVWLSNVAAWQYTTKTEFFYQPHNELDYFTVFHWDNSLNIWLIQNKDKFVYASGITFYDLVLPYSIAYSHDYFDFMLNEITYYGYVNENFLENNRESFFYSAINLIGIEEIGLSESKVYPVPATDYVTFSWQENAAEFNVELYDICGRLIMSRTVSKGEAVSMHSFGKGLYTYKLTDRNNRVSVGKICLQ